MRKHSINAFLSLMLVALLMVSSGFCSFAFSSDNTRKALPLAVGIEALRGQFELVDPLRALIDSFIAKHGKNVDATRIFIGGSSAGGEMCWDMALAYPEYFAGIYLLAATGTRTAEDIQKAKDVAIL